VLHQTLRGGHSIVFYAPRKNPSNFKFETLLVEKAQQQTKTPRNKERKKKKKNKLTKLQHDHPSATAGTRRHVR